MTDEKKSMQVRCEDGRIRRANVKMTGGYMPDVSVCVDGKTIQGFIYERDDTGYPKFVAYTEEESDDLL